MIQLSVWELIALLTAGWIIPSPLKTKIKGENIMDKEFFEKDLGSVAKVDVGLKSGSLVASFELPLVAILQAGATKVKAAIPGQVDDAIIDLIVNTLITELSK